MLDYTKMAIRQTVADLKHADYVRNVATQLIYISYLIYALIAKTGVLAANIVLLAVSVIYFVFFLATTSFGKNPEGKKLKCLRRSGKTMYRWFKRVIRLFTLGIAIYGINSTVKHPTSLSVILTAFMIVGIVLQILFEVIIRSVANRISLIMEGLEADLGDIVKPVKTVSNFFKKITGKEVEPPKEPTKNQLKLKEKVEAYRAEQKANKAENKRRRAEERTKLRAEKREANKNQRRKEKKAIKRNGSFALTEYTDLASAEREERTENEKASGNTEENVLTETAVTTYNDEN